MPNCAILCLLFTCTIVHQIATQQIATAIQLVRPDSLHFQLELVPDSLSAFQNINSEVAVLGGTIIQTRVKNNK